MKLSNMNPDLGQLADPEKFVEPIEVCGEDTDFLLKSLYQMILVRKAEEKIGDMITAKKIVCPCHLAIGQEACAVGVAKNLKTTDRIFGTHRSHAHFLATGGSLEQLFAEVLGKETGCSNGLGGSMHLHNEAQGFKGSVPIVAGTISLAVGAGLAAQKDQKSPMDIGLCFFGDGACEEGSLHESLNIASQFKIPVLFVCENNLFSSHMHIKVRQPSNVVSRFAHAHCINYEIVDGNDVVAVRKASQNLIDNAREGKGPGFLELITYRWRGHVGPREDTDVGLKRDKDLVKWKNRDPISRLVKSLTENKLLSGAEYSKMSVDIDREIRLSWEKADSAQYPDQSKLLEYVHQVSEGL